MAEETIQEEVKDVVAAEAPVQAEAPVEQKKPEARRDIFAELGLADDDMSHWFAIEPSDGY